MDTLLNRSVSDSPNCMADLNKMSRRHFFSSSIVTGAFCLTGARTAVSATQSTIPSKMRVTVTLNGVLYKYPDGPTIPSYYVTFCADGRIVFHLGALGDLSGTSATAEPYHLPSHQVRIEQDGAIILDATVPAHWWNAQWTYRPKALAATRPPTQLVAANRMFRFGDTGCTVNPVVNYRFVGPMDSAGITKYMPTTGERPDIGLVTDPSGHFMLTTDSSPMLAWAQAAGSCPLHFRDEATGKPIDLIKYPQANSYDEPSIQGSPWLPKGPRNAHGVSTFGGGWVPQQAHFCEMSYAAYMATGDLGFLEDLQFSANFCVLANAYRSSSRGAVIYSGEQRGVAWSLREVFMAHIATKDAETAGNLPISCHSSSYWKTLLDQSLPFYNRYIADPKNQVFKLVGTNNRFAPWQHDYLLSALAFALLTGHSEWASVYLFALGNAIDRTSGKSGYPVGWGGAYYLNTYEWAKEPSGKWNQNAYDANKPLDWYTSFLFMQNDPNGPRPTQEQIDTLKADPLNGGIAMEGHEYLMTTRAVLVMANHLDKAGIVGVRKAHPDFDTCLTNVDRMYRANGKVNARDSVVTV